MSEYIDFEKTAHQYWHNVYSYGNICLRPELLDQWEDCRLDFTLRNLRFYIDVCIVLPRLCKVTFSQPIKRGEGPPEIEGAIELGYRADDATVRINASKLII